VVDAAREVRRSFGLRIAVALLGLVAAFSMTVLAVRTLSPREATTFLAILAALMVGPMLGRLGLGQSLIRALAGAPSPGAASAQVKGHLRATMVLSAVSAPVVAWFATLGADRSRGAVWALVTVLVVAETLRLTLSDVYAARGQVVRSVSATHHARSIIVLAVLGTAVLGAESSSLVSFLLLYAATSCCLLVLHAVPVMRSVRGTKVRSWHLVRTAVLSGAQLFVLEVGAFLVGRGDVWLSAWAFPAEEALRYSTASVLAMQVTVVEGLANIAIFPVAARLWAAGRRDQVIGLLRASATLTTAVTGLLVVLTWLLAPWVLGVAYGEDLRAAAPLLVVLASGGLAMAVFGGCAVLLVVSGHARAAAWSVGLTLAVVIPAGVAAGVLGGPMSLALVSAGSTVVLHVAYGVTCRRVLSEVPLPSLRVRRTLQALRSGEDPAPAALDIPVATRDGSPPHGD
jgi:O-antigen/teichoic acid export membrane protein